VEAAFDAIGRDEVAVCDVACVNGEDHAVRHTERAVNLAKGESGLFKPKRRAAMLCCEIATGSTAYALPLAFSNARLDISWTEEIEEKTPQDTTN
jgi:hypothetical protein